MKRKLKLILSAVLISATLCSCAGAPAETTAATTPAPETAPTETEAETEPEPEASGTPVDIHGQLSVKGAQLVDSKGEPFQLRGMSTHGMTWFPAYVNEDAFLTLRDDWNTNIVRLAMYVDEWDNDMCYMNNKDGSRRMMERGVDICLDLGMYVIIDWHVLNPGDPTKYTDEAIEFFEYITEKYADYPNIIYEICNEPNGGNVTWDDVIKPYAERVIPVIRERDSDAVIIVGTPTWSQEIDKALNNPLDFENVMYALHFYAATHKDWLRDRVENCVDNGLPVFVSEFGCCDASGNGKNDFDEAEKWLSMLDSRKISYCNWALANKDETCCVIGPKTKATAYWFDEDLTEGGRWIRDRFKKH